jgi:hypothetical protein
VLLACFVAVEHRIRHLLPPLHIAADRSRGRLRVDGAVGAALFSVFLFMTFCSDPGVLALKTALGFLPLTGAVIITAPLVQTKILPRLGPRAVIVTGMILGIIAMIIFGRDARRVLRQPGATRAHSPGPGSLRLPLVRHRHARRRSQ